MKEIAMIYPTNNLLGWWQLEGNANSSYGSLHGTPENSPTYGAGQPFLGSQAINLNGTNQCVNIGTDPSLRLSNLGLSLWVYGSVITGKDQVYFSRDSNVWSHPNGCYRIGTNSANGYLYYIVNLTNGYYLNRVSGTVLPSGRWNHLVLTQSASLAPTMYLNGSVVVVDGYAGPINSPASYETLIGALMNVTPGARTNFSANPIDEVLLYNRILSLDEITTFYQKGSMRFSNGSGGGVWSNAATWDTVKPSVGERVRIYTGDTVEIDENATIGDAPNDTTTVLRVDGTLKWKIEESTDRTFKCRGSVALLKGSTLQIGSAVEPIPATQKANFIFEKSTSTATVWNLMLANFTDSDRTAWGNLLIHGNSAYHMADAASQRTYLSYGVVSGTDKTIVFDDPVDYQVGDTVWIGFGGDPTVDPFNGTAISAAYGSDTVLIKTKIDARTYTVDLTYTHVVGDFVIHKTRNVVFGCLDADTMKISPMLYSAVGIDGFTETDWAGTISVNWAYLNKLEEIFRATGIFCFTDTNVPKFKNCIVNAPTYGVWVYNVGGCQVPWFETIAPFLDEVHIFKMASWFIYDHRAFATGMVHFGHLSIVDNMLMTNDGNNTGFMSDYNADSRSNQTLEWDSAWISWDRSHATFNYLTTIMHWGFGLKIYSMRARVIPGGFSLRSGSEGREVLLNDMQVQHCYGSFFRMLSADVFPTTTLTNCKFANMKSDLFVYTLGNGSYSNLEFYECDFDGMASTICRCACDGRQAFFNIQWKFVNCNFGMMSPNAYMLYLEDIWFRTSGRILFENCQIKKPTNVTASGVWTGIKGYCVQMVASSYAGYIPTNTTYRQLMPPTMSYEWVNCKIYDSNGIDQFAIEYPNKVCAVVGGGGELCAENAIIIDGSLGMKMLPYAVHCPHSGNKANAIRIPLLPGEAVTLKVSLRKNYSLPEGKRPTFNARGCGIDSCVEMTDGINTWEELTITGTAQYEDTLEAWVTGGWNLYNGTTDNFWTPMALGTIVSYADKFVCQKTNAPAPKVISAQSLALNKVRVNFNRSMLINDTLLQFGKGISQHTSLASDLIAYYKFDENVQDSGPNVLHGTVYGGDVTYHPGKIGNGIKLNGISQYVKVPYNTLFNPNYLSIAMWFRLDANPSTTTCQLVSKHMPGWSQYSISCGYGGEVRMRTGSVARQMTLLTAWSDGGWHFLALTYDGARLKVQFDETVIQQVQTGTIDPYSTDLHIGAYYNGTTYSSFFNGIIDELMIAGRCWSDEERELIYNSGRGRKYAEAAPSSYTIDGGQSAVLVTPYGFKSVDLNLEANMTPGSSYTAGVIASSGLVDQNGVAFDDANRSASFSCYNSIRTHPTLSDGSLCGAWLLDGDATDSSGNGYHGTIGGTPTFVAGKVGQGLDFAAGASNTVWINPMYLDRKKLNCTTKFMLSCWVKFNTITATTQCIFTKYTTETKTGDEHYHWMLYKNSSNNISFYMQGGNVTGPAATTSWVHFACGYDGRTVVLYVNGVLYGFSTNAQPRHNPTYPLIPIRIGSGGVDADPPYPIGDISYVVNAIVNQALFFNRLLTSDEVKSLYGAGNGLVW
jgi:hypothetical protein